MEKAVGSRSPIINPTRMRLAEYERQEWIANAEYGVTVDDVQKQDYWSHMAMQLKPYDHIEVRSEDGTWIANLLVINAERNYAKVHLLDYHELVKTQVEAPTKLHEVRWRGPQHKHAVVRLSDGAVIKEDFSEKSMAESWLAEHERAIV